MGASITIGHKTCSLGDWEVINVVDVRKDILENGRKAGALLVLAVIFGEFGRCCCDQ